MSKLAIILFSFGISVIIGGIVDYLFRKNKELKTENEKLKQKNDTAKKTSEQMKVYINNATSIKAEKQEIIKKLRESKNEEEVYGIINDIVARNNSKLQNDKD
jgi:sulfur transfer complex TusBCD TusB component (DsrH family)